MKYHYLCWHSKHHIFQWFPFVSMFSISLQSHPQIPAFLLFPLNSKVILLALKLCSVLQGIVHALSIRWNRMSFCDIQNYATRVQISTILAGGLGGKQEIPPSLFLHMQIIMLYAPRKSLGRIEYMLQSSGFSCYTEERKHCLLLPLVSVMLGHFSIQEYATYCST